MSDMMKENIKSGAGYNLGGIASILLLEKEHFWGYEFTDDNLYDEFLVSKVFRTTNYIELDIVDESVLNQTLTNEIYKHELKSFVRVAHSKTTRLLEYARQKRFVVFFKTRQGQYFTFGSDGGVQLSYTIQTDATQGVNGMSMSIVKNSIYPIFEIMEEAIFNIPSHFVPDFDNFYCVG